MKQTRSARRVTAAFRGERRRFFVAALALLFAGRGVAQQRGRIPRVAIFGVGPSSPILDRAFDEGLRALGYVDGKNIEIIRRNTGGNVDLLPQAARDLVREDIDVIVTGLNTGTTAVKNATNSIPIVMIIGTDVVAAGYAKSLARPGGNITGFAWDLGDGGGIAKRVELLKETVPAMARLAILWEPPSEVTHRANTEAAASALGLSTLWFRFTGDTRRHFADIAAWRADAVYHIVGPIAYTKRSELAAVAIESRLPVMYTSSFYADAGGLMSYGPDLVDTVRSTARFIDKILKGARPADLPIERPTRFELVINLKTAKAIGLTIPRVTLTRAERIIE